MKLRIACTLFTCSLLVIVGCDRDIPVGERATKNMNVSAQLEAALSISNPIQRDEALGEVAQTAGEAGNGGVAMAAVVAMQNPNLKDDAAVATAKKLAKAGVAAEATAMAKIILNPIVRDQTLLELSKM